MRGRVMEARDEGGAQSLSGHARRAHLPRGADQTAVGNVCGSMSVSEGAKPNRATVRLCS